MLWVQEHPITQTSPQCKGIPQSWRPPSTSYIPKLYERINGGIVTYVSVDSAGKYWGHQAYGNGQNNPNNLNTKDMTRSMQRGFALASNNYMGSVDINDYREHCTSAAAWTSYWYHYPPYKLTALFDGTNKNKALPYGKQKKVLVCFRGFGCEGRVYKYEFISRHSKRPE